MIEAAILIGLASWRLANMLIDEDGPFNIFEIIRNDIGAYGEIEGFIPKLFSCMWCMSVWTTIIIFFLWVVEPIGVMLMAAMAIPPLVHQFVK